MEARRVFTGNRYFYLLASLILFFIASAFFAGSRLSMLLIGGFFTLVVLLSVYAIEYKRRLLVVCSLLGLIAIGGHWSISMLSPAKEYYLIDYISTILFLIVITSAVLSYVYHEHRVTAGTLFGAICGYLLIGLAWSFIYLLIHTVDPSAFLFSQKEMIGSSPQNFIYYSFVTLSTLGYGDVVPLANVAKTAAWFEAVVGQIYLTVWLAQLVGLHISQKNKD